MNVFANVDGAIAGVDGCRAGWVAVVRQVDGLLSGHVFPTFKAIIDTLPADATIAVDMPIGLPELTGKGGRGPEALVRPLLGQRQSSVFSLPSRPAVWAETAPFSTVEAWYAAHRRASEVARRTSEPPRGVSIQAFGIFSKIREIDQLLVENPEFHNRVIESHPELAFWRMNGETPLNTPKKIKGSVNPAGMAARRELLVLAGLDSAFVNQAPPHGAASDDFLDACAMLVTAARLRRGAARSFPNPPARDSHGLPIAIWV